MRKPALSRISVWRFESAPEWARRLSRHGGDEDWVIVVPRQVDREGRKCGWAWWRDMPVFGDWQSQFTRAPNGDLVVIVAHA
jgi:hypothetical protein